MLAQEGAEVDVVQRVQRMRAQPLRACQHTGHAAQADVGNDEQPPRFGVVFDARFQVRQQPFAQAVHAARDQVCVAVVASTGLLHDGLVTRFTQQQFSNDDVGHVLAQVQQVRGFGFQPLQQADEAGLARRGRFGEEAACQQPVQRLQRFAHHVPHARALGALAGRVVGGRKFQRPVQPLAIHLLTQVDEVVALEGVVPMGQRRAGWAAEFGVHGAHHREGVVVPAHPDVQAVFFDAVMLAAAAGALAAQAPAQLIDGDGLVAAAPVCGVRQRIGGSQRRRAAAQDHELLCGGHRAALS